MTPQFKDNACQLPRFIALLFREVKTLEPQAELKTSVAGRPLLAVVFMLVPFPLNAGGESELKWIHKMGMYFM